MAGINQYYAFAASGGANTLAPSAWAALTTLIGQGFQPGVASSEQINTLLRQVSTAASGTAQFAVTQSGGDALDDGTPANFAALLLLAVQKVIDARVAAGLVPAGMMMSFAAAAPPPGWIVANGASLLRVAYPALFANIGTTWGAADINHFYIPDARGVVLRGWDAGRGLDALRAFASYQADDNKAHTHFDGDSGVFPGSTTGGGFATVNQAGAGTQSSTSSSGGVEARMKNIAILTCIKT